MIDPIYYPTIVITTIAAIFVAYVSYFRKDK